MHHHDHDIPVSLKALFDLLISSGVGERAQFDAGCPDCGQQHEGGMKLSGGLVDLLAVPGVPEQLEQIIRGIKLPADFRDECDELNAVMVLMSELSNVQISRDIHDWLKQNNHDLEELSREERKAVLAKYKPVDTFRGEYAFEDMVDKVIAIIGPERRWYRTVFYTEISAIDARRRQRDGLGDFLNAMTEAMQQDMEEEHSSQAEPHVEGHRYLN